MAVIYRWRPPDRARNGHVYCSPGSLVADGLALKCQGTEGGVALALTIRCQAALRLLGSGILGRYQCQLTVDSDGHYGFSVQVTLSSIGRWLVWLGCLAQRRPAQERNRSRGQGVPC